jgi:hypothetical protein
MGIDDEGAGTIVFGGYDPASAFFVAELEIHAIEGARIGN